MSVKQMDELKAKCVDYDDRLAEYVNANNILKDLNSMNERSTSMRIK